MSEGAIKIDSDALLSGEMRDAGIVLTPQGIVLQWARGAARTFGYRGGESVGRPVDPQPFIARMQPFLSRAGSA